MPLLRPRSTVLPHRPILRPLALLTGLASAAVLTGCGTGLDPTAQTGVASPSAPTTAVGPAEAAAVTPRLTVTYEGGVQVLDATTLEVVADLPLPGFNRLNPAGDGRHVLVSTEGTEEARTGIRVLDAKNREIDESTQCPGVHGEATAEDETVVIGCTDGALVYRNGRITKVDSPDDYGRIGNQAGTDVSPVVLGDYKVDEDAELERPTRVSLIDTEKAKLKLVELPSSYTFRSLGRGPKGEALVLGTDGKLHMIDPASGKITSSVALMDSWTEPDEWQSPRPTLKVNGDIAYVSDPATKSIMSVDLTKDTVITKATLPSAPNELAVASGTEEPQD